MIRSRWSLPVLWVGRDRPIGMKISLAGLSFASVLRCRTPVSPLGLVGLADMDRTCCGREGSASSFRLGLRSGSRTAEENERDGRDRQDAPDVKVVSTNRDMASEGPCLSTHQPHYISTCDNRKARPKEIQRRAESDKSRVRSPQGLTNRLSNSLDIPTSSTVAPC